MSRSPGLIVLRRPRRVPVPTERCARWLRVVLLVVLLVLLAGGAVGLARAEEEEPTEVPRYSPSSRSSRPAVARWESLLAAYPWDVETALRIVGCESGGDPDAVNPYSGAAGLMQLYGWSRLARRLFGTGDVLIPWVNVATAFALWEDSGGTFRWHWASSAGCWR